MDSGLPTVSMHPTQPLSIISSTGQSINDASIDELVTGFTALHRRCIMEDATIATFLPPLDDSKMRDFWLGLIQQCRSSTPESGEKVIVYLAEDGAISGVASLLLPWSQTGNHRAWVEKLMVDGRLRQRGIARRLMDELEGIAIEKGKWILVSFSVYQRFSVLIGCSFLILRRGVRRRRCIPSLDMSSMAQFRTTR